MHPADFSEYISKVQGTETFAIAVVSVATFTNTSLSKRDSTGYAPRRSNPSPTRSTPAPLIGSLINRLGPRLSTGFLASRFLIARRTITDDSLYDKTLLCILISIAMQTVLHR